MTRENPYLPPESDIDPGSEKRELNEKTFYHLSRGQKMVINAIVFNFLALVILVPAVVSSPYIGGLNIGGLIAVSIIVFALVLGVFELIRILLGSQLETFSKILLFIGMFIPFINLVALARINHIATKELLASRYKVGLLGAKGGYVA